LQMAVAELALARARHTRARGPLAVLAAVAALAAAAAWVGHDNGGREIFYAYVALHGRLFGP